MATVWQVQIEEEWKYATAETAAFCECNRPGAVRLADMPVPHGIRFERFIRAKRKQITPRLVAASALALKRERDKSPLFAAQIAAVQPTAQARREAIEDAHVRWWSEYRRWLAAAWRTGRRMLRAQSSDRRVQILFSWSVCRLPGDPVYFIEHIRANLAR